MRQFPNMILMSLEAFWHKCNGTLIIIITYNMMVKFLINGGGDWRAAQPQVFLAHTGWEHTTNSTAEKKTKMLY